MSAVSRFEDMTAVNELIITVQVGGDVQISIDFGDDTATLVFREPVNGGGGSPRTHQALLELAAAMRDDNSDKSRQHRKGLYG